MLVFQRLVCEFSSWQWELEMKCECFQLLKLSFIVKDIIDKYLYLGRRGELRKLRTISSRNASGLEMQSYDMDDVRYGIPRLAGQLLL